MTRPARQRRPPGAKPARETFRTIGPLRIPHVGMRRCRVFLPTHRPDERLPLLLMWDGQNIFGDGGSYAGGWHVHRAVSARVRRNAPVPVVVGIDHGGVARGRELSPFHPRGSLTEPLLDWVESSLLPRLSHELPISIAARDVTLGGSSLGGLNALYAHLTRPQIFGHAIAMSPSLWASGDRLFRIAASSHRHDQSTLYIDCGGLEGDGVLARHAEELVHLLRHRGWHGTRLMWRLVKSGRHHETYWARRLPRALTFLYGA
jgi:enterochelin esterase-like enzyme